MDAESVNLSDLTTAELIYGPTMTHMAQGYRRMQEITLPILATGNVKTIESFGEMQISMANLFKDITEMTARFRALVEFME